MNQRSWIAVSGPLSPRLPGGEGWGEGGVSGRSALPFVSSCPLAPSPYALTLSPADGGEGTRVAPP